MSEPRRKEEKKEGRNRNGEKGWWKRARDESDGSRSELPPPPDTPSPVQTALFLTVPRVALMIRVCVRLCMSVHTPYHTSLTLDCSNTHTDTHTPAHHNSLAAATKAQRIQKSSRHLHPSLHLRLFHSAARAQPCTSRLCLEGRHKPG